jgi:hypothetical protein
MEPVSIITTAITSALTELGKKSVADAYEQLKTAIKKRFGEEGELSKALVELEQKPGSAGRKLTLQEAVAELGVADVPEILDAARALLAQAQPGEKRVQQIISGNYNAQAEGGSSASVNVQGPSAD